MSILQWIDRIGLDCRVDSLKIWQSVDVRFVNSEGFDDETQFDVRGIGTMAGNRELSRLFKDFCKENRFPENTVCGVTVVSSAYSYEELENLESNLQY